MVVIYENKLNIYSPFTKLFSGSVCLNISRESFLWLLLSPAGKQGFAIASLHRLIHQVRIWNILQMEMITDR